MLEGINFKTLKYRQTPALSWAPLHCWWGRWPPQDSWPEWPGGEGCSPAGWWCWCLPQPSAGAWPLWSGQSPRPHPRGSGHQSHGGSGQGSAAGPPCCSHSILWHKITHILQADISQLSILSSMSCKTQQCKSITLPPVLSWALLFIYSFIF